MNSNILVFVFLTIFVGTQSCGDFYWRDYEGVIPSDALTAYTDKYIQRYYIGQAYVHNYGFVIGSIFQNAKDTTIVHDGVVETVNILKILCVSDTSKYYWLSASNSTYKSSTSNRCPVKGGYKVTIGEDGNPIQQNLYVGRNTYYDKNNNLQPVIGSIFTSDTETVFKYVKIGEAYVDSSFSVLMYSDYPVV